MKVCEARSSEFHSKWGEPGNQEYRDDLKDGELRVRELNDSFDKVLRWSDRSKAKVAADMAVEIAKNPLVGYSQNNGSSPRTTLYDELLKANWIPANIASKCNTDCSALMAVVVNGAGVKVSKDIYTGNMIPALMNTGEFEMMQFTKGMELMVGDILWRDGHTAIMVGDGGEEPDKKLVATASVWLRNAAGTPAALPLKALKAGDEVEYMGESVTWYKVKHGGKVGWMSGKYLKEK